MSGQADFVASRPYVPLPARLAVLLSGRGSNFAALVRACEDGRIPGRVELVLSDSREAGGLTLAGERGIRALAVVREPGESRESHETRLVAELEASRIDLICLAGFMRLLSRDLLARYPYRVLNIHPSLLPAFPGLHAQAQAIRYGVRLSGVTVHFVDAGMDTGPIVAQRSVPVLDEDGPEALAERLLPVEHALYPEAVQAVLQGGWVLDGRRIHFPAPESHLRGIAEGSNRE